MKILNIFFLTFIAAITTSIQAANFELISKMIDNPDSPKTVEQFLEVLSQKDPEFFKHFTLMRESQSLQGSTPQFPRAIVFGEDAKFVLTFNGSPNQTGYQKIEMMQFVESQDGKSGFELRELTFGKDQRPMLSAANPAECSRCHGTDPKPIWEEYDRWPGAFGEDDDALIDFDEVQKYPPGGYDNPQYVATHRQHLKEYRAFQKLRTNHERYRFLNIPRDMESPVAPYIPATRSGKFPLRPNLHLSKSFAELNSRKLSSGIFKRDDQCINTGLPILTVLLINCGDHRDIKGRLKVVTEAMTQDALKFPPPVALTPAHWNSLNDPTVRLETIHLLNLMGISDYDWSSARLKRQWNYFQGYDDASDKFLEFIWPTLAKQGFNLPSYKAVYKNLHPYSNYDLSEYDSEDSMGPDKSAVELACLNLTDSIGLFSIEKFKSSCLNSRDQQDPGIPKTIQMCLTCHSGKNTSAPPLPLDRLSELRKVPGLIDRIWERIDATSPSQRMPPDRPMTIREYRELQRYFSES